MGHFDLASFLLAAPVLLFSIVAHEWAHGYAAYHQGDTSVNVTWDPRPYIDPVGSILVPALTLLVGAPPFGWARSWPIDKRRFRNFKRGDIIVSLAGVTANFCLALIFAGLIVLTGLVGRTVPALAPSVSILQAMFERGILINAVLCVLNLLPLPPFDGSHVMKYLLSPKLALEYMRISRYGFAIFLALMTFAKPVLQLWMTPAYLLYAAAAGAARPFMLANPWLS